MYQSPARTSVGCPCMSVPDRKSEILSVSADTKKAKVLQKRMAHKIKTGTKGDVRVRP